MALVMSVATSILPVQLFVFHDIDSILGTARPTGRAVRYRLLLNINTFLKHYTTKALPHSA